MNDEVRYQVLLPQCLKPDVIRALHDENGHFGLYRVLELARARFYWQHMAQDIKTAIKQCGRCIRRKSSTTKPQATLVPIVSSYPLEIHSDQGRNFESDIIRLLCTLAGVRKSRTTPYHPMGNPVCERFNYTLLAMLGTLTSEKKVDWKSNLPSLVHAYNASKHETTRFSPFYLMFGRRPRLPADVAFGLDPDNNAYESVPEFVRKFKERLHRAYDIASTEAKKAAERDKKRYDLRVKEIKLEVGDRVLVRSVGFKGKHKLADKWDDAIYTVLEQPNVEIPVFTVQREDKKGPKRTLHRNMLLSLATIPIERPVNSTTRTKAKTTVVSSSGEETDSSDDEPVLQTTTPPPIVNPDLRPDRVREPDIIIPGRLHVEPIDENDESINDEPAASIADDEPEPVHEDDEEVGLMSRADRIKPIHLPRSRLFGV